MNSDTDRGRALPPPRTESGAIGWLHANLFSSVYNSAMTVVAGIIVAVTLWFSIGWVMFEADWKVIATLGGQMAIGQYNTVAACPSQNCFWRPQAALLLVTALLGMGWGMAGGGLTKRMAIGIAVALAAFALLPYSFERMGMDVRLLLVANLPALGIGWLIARYTPLGTPRWIIISGVGVFLATLLLLRGIEGVPGLEPVSVIYWGGMMLNLLLAVAGIVLSLPIGNRARARTAKPTSRGQDAVRGIHRDVPRCAADNAAVHVAGSRAARLPGELPGELAASSGNRDHAIQLGLHGREHSRRSAGAASRPSRGGARAGYAGLANDDADIAAAGHTQRDSGHRRPVHRAVQRH